MNFKIVDLNVSDKIYMHITKVFLMEGSKEKYTDIFEVLLGKDKSIILAVDTNQVNLSEYQDKISFYFVKDGDEKFAVVSGLNTDHEDLITLFKYNNNDLSFTEQKKIVTPTLAASHR